MIFFGIPVVVHWTFFLVMALLGGADQARTGDEWIEVGLFMAAGTASILVHEFGHALTGRKFGAWRPAIQLYGMGGLCTFQQSSFKRWQDFLVTFAGPLAGYAFGLAAWAGWHWFPEDGPPRGEWLLQRLVFINFIWSTFNLLPVLPLDGGQMLRALLGPRRLRVTLVVSMVVAVLCIPLSLFSGYFIMPILFAYFTWENYKTFKAVPRSGYWRAG